ncbi:MAG: biopolymer transporter ExbD [Gammaproteobacteria bacterium]|nr:biopolymer transporter ExbD [Gammaproteobacteria bacterium]
MTFIPEPDDEPEINLIPLIDVLLMALIFLLVTTSFSIESHLHIRLPKAATSVTDNKTPSIRITIDANEQYFIGNDHLPKDATAALRYAMAHAAGNNKDPLVIIDADAKTPHEAVVHVMDMAQQLGFTHLTFSTRKAEEHHGK